MISCGSTLLRTPLWGREITGAGAVLSEHRAASAEGQKLEGVTCISDDTAEHPRPHPDGKLEDTDVTELRSQEMTELMEENQEAETCYSDDDTDNSHKLLNKR